jgi:hypothetical protein
MGVDGVDERAVEIEDQRLHACQVRTSDRGERDLVDEAPDPVLPLLEATHDRLAVRRSRRPTR